MLREMTSTGKIPEDFPEFAQKYLWTVQIMADVTAKSGMNDRDRKKFLGPIVKQVREFQGHLHKLAEKAQAEQRPKVFPTDEHAK